MSPGPPNPHRDERAELDVLGAAMLDVEVAARVTEQLSPLDFTGKDRRAIWQAIAERHVRGESAISPAAVWEELGPDAAATFQLEVDDLTTWTMDSQAAHDGALLGSYVGKLRKLHIKRQYQTTLRQLLEQDPEAESQSGREAQLSLLEEAESQLCSLFQANGTGGMKGVDLVAAAAAQEEEPIPWVITGWLCEGDVAMLAGDSGIGKSYLLLDLTLRLALGGKFLGVTDILAPPQRVLYVDEEQNPRLVRYRVRKWARGAGVTPDQVAGAQISYLAENQINLDDDQAYARLRQEIDRFRPDWIMLDSLVRFHRRNENDNAQMSDWFQSRLKRLAGRTGAGVVILHHLRKLGGQTKGKDEDIRDRLRGASDFRAWVDQLWGLEEDRETGAKRLIHDKCRWTGESAPLKFEIEDVDHCEGVVLFSAGRADDGSGAVWSALMDSTYSGQLRGELIAVAKDEGIRDPSRAVSRYLREWYADKKVAKVKEGKKARYYISMFAPAEALEHSASEAYS